MLRDCYSHVNEEELLNQGSQGPTDEYGASSISSFVGQLRNRSGVPVNFIESEDVVLYWPSTDQDVAAILDALVMQTDHYRWRTVGERYVLYPRDPVWDSSVSRVDIRDVARLDAATRYVAVVRSQIPALEDLLPPVLLGDPRAPIYAERVSLSPESSVVGHLVELLGMNRRLAFTVEHVQSGQRALNFWQVGPEQAPDTDRHDAHA